MHHTIKVARRVMASMILVVTGTVALSTGAHAADTPAPASKTAAQTSDAGVLAGGPNGNYTCVSTTGAKACFARKGDHIWVKDTKKDGHHARAGLFWLDPDRPCTGCPPPRTFSRTCKNYKGAGTWKHCDFNVLEDKLATLSAKRYEGGKLLNSDHRSVRT